ncbi:HNH endonuclease signature motif containing protein [Nocardioides salsibiostraticola]
MTDQPLDSSPSGAESPDASEEALAALLGTNRSIADLEVIKLRQIVEWIVINEVDPVTHEKGILCNRAVRTSGEGSPFVTEFDLMEFSAVLGLTTESGEFYVAKVAELRYRLPLLWNAVEAGKIPAWKAIRVAECTYSLPEAGAHHVDRHLVLTAGSCSWAQVDRLVEEATARFDPEKAEEQRKRRADRRRFDIGLGHVGIDGVVQVDASLDLADALDLEAAIGSVAHQLLGLGCEESLDVRRSIAAGEIARAQGALDLDPGAGGFEARRPGAPHTSTNGDGDQRTSKPAPRTVVLHVHLTDAAIRGEDNVARCANTRTPITVEQVRSWCGQPDTRVIVRPILDVDQHHFVEAYEIPRRLEEQAEITAGTCVFPYCTRDAVKCDKDHVIAHADGGLTCSCNLAPLCRKHHRAKTHSRWSYVVLDPGVYLWTTPTGFDLIRDQRGTRRVLTPDPGDPAEP